MKSSIAAGNWSTAATWGTVTNTPTLHATTVLTLSGSNTFTAGFTAPNLVNACNGVWIYLSTPGTATINVTLQVATVDTAATKSITTSTGTSTNSAGWYFFEFATPYVFLSLTASTYRFRINATSITTAPSIAADSGGTLAAYLAVDNRTGTPGAEGVMIGNYAVTMDGTQTVGAGTDTATLGTGAQRSIGFGVQVAYGGSLIWDTAASATLTCLGHFGVSVTGIVNFGTVASPYPTGKIATLTFNENGTTGNYGFHYTPTATIIGQGEPKTSTSLWKTFYSSGAGTAASPLVTSTAVDWSVGDQICIAGSVYNQAEYRFIITKNSSTSYVVSNTAGGAENAFTNTHATDHPIINLTRNVVINTTNAAQAWYMVGGAAAAGQVNWDWVRFETAGVPGVASKQGIMLSFNTGAGTTSTYSEMDYCVSYAPLFDGFAVTNSQTTQTFTGLVTVRSANTSSITTGGGFALLANSSNKTFVDCYAIDWQGSGVFMSTPVNMTFTRLNTWNCNGNNSTGCGGILAAGSAITYNSCNIQAIRSNGVNFASATKHTFNSVACGNLYTNTIDIFCTSAGTNLDCHFEGPTVGSATLVSGYTSQGFGSKISMQNINGVATDNRTYEANGTTRSTGSGLADTNVRTASSLAWRIAPENNTTGMVKDLKILAKANSAVSVFGFLQKNAAFGTSTLQVDLILPGQTTSSATQTMGNGTDWQVFNLAASYSGSVDLFATLRITAITATASAYVYLDDLYNGTNKITAIDVFDRGEPSPIQFEQLGDASAVWSVLTSTQTTSGTMGYLVTKLLTVAKFIGLK